MKPTVSVALAQIDIEPLEPQINLAKIERTVARIVAERHVDLIVFPALANSGYPAGGLVGDRPSFLFAAEAEKGVFVTGLRRIAEEHQVNLVVGLLEADPKGGQTAFSSGLLIDSGGQVLGLQRQLHVLGRDKLFFSRGDAIEVFPSPLGNIALIIGTDLEYPEVARIQALKGAEVICTLVNSHQELENPREWLALICICRAMEEKLYFLACNCVGRHAGSVFFGGSCIAYAGGEVLAQSSAEGEDIVRGDLSADLFIEERALRPYFRDRRPEKYGMVCR